MALTVREGPSSSTRVELFQAGRRPLRVELNAESALGPIGEESGVRLWVCLWDGLSGVSGKDCPLIRLNSEALCRKVGAGSDDGVLVSSLGIGGVSGIGDFEVLCLSLRASFRNGEIDRARGFPGLSPLDLEDCVLSGGVSKLGFCDREVVADTLDPVSLGGSPTVKSFLTFSISLSVRAMRSWR